MSNSDTDRRQSAPPPVLLGLLANENLRPTGRTSRRKMMHTLSWSLFWGCLYLAIALAPLGLVLVGVVPAGRGFLLEFGVGLGIVGFSLLALQFVTTGRFHQAGSHFGTDMILLFHRQMGLAAFAFVVAHPLVLFVARPEYLEYLDIRVNAMRTIALVAATIAVTLLVATSLWRERFGLNYEWWRFVHAGLSVLVLLVGLVHALQVGHYVASLWKQALWVILTAVPLLLLAHVRLVRPWLAGRRPYRVAEVRKERGDSCTLVLDPEDHAGAKFSAGQYYWITVGPTAFSLQQHPYSTSSSAQASGRVEFTIKALGDFSTSVRDLPPGERAYLEGPFGTFTLEAQPLDGAVFIMGGIGITPAMSMLRGCRDRGDRRPMLLIYANTDWEGVAFREELEELRQELNLTVVHVLEEAPEGWQGETGLLTPELLDRHLPTDGRDYHYFVCGPLKMSEIVERALSARGVPIWNRSVELFQMV